MPGPGGSLEVQGPGVRHIARAAVVSGPDCFLMTSLPTAPQASCGCRGLRGALQGGLAIRRALGSWLE